MQRKSLAAALLVLLCAWPLSSARADRLLDLSGRVGLLDGVAPDGVKVKLQVDLDRDRELSSFETASATVNSDGSYTLRYELDPRDVDFEFLAFVTKLVAAYQERGFAALLDRGPLPIVLSFEREGYSTIVKRFTTLTDVPRLDVLLTPLRQVQCSGARCLSSDGSVRLSGLPAGSKVARAYAQAYDPTDDTPRFPGSFSDDEDNLLKSSGFAEINLHDAEGNLIHELSAPVAVRFRAKRTSWHTLPDLTPGSGRVELPMYSFDRQIGEWVREADGELQTAEGAPVPESELSAIRAGTYAGELYVAFSTRHFSTFNCDAPIEEHACVTGRIVSATGTAMAGVQVSVDGVSYTGNTGGSFTGKDGRFSADVMRSENPGEDVDVNGKTGESFTAQVVATGTGVFVGAPFVTPRVQGTVRVSARSLCMPGACTCLDLGDIEVDFEPPRACEISVHTRFSGTHAVGDGGPLAAGDAVAEARVRGTLSGGISPPQASVAELCSGVRCNGGTADQGGNLTFVVPVVGDAPSVQLDAELLSREGDTLHYYSGTLTVSGCARGQARVEASVDLTLDHAALSDLGAYVSSLGPGPAPGGASGATPQDPLDVKDPLDCGCRLWQGPSRTAFGGAGLLSLALALVARRRRRR